MKTTLVSLLLFSVLLLSGFRQLQPGQLAGRWDLTLVANGETYPSWIEIGSEAQPAIRLQGRVGSNHPVQDIKLEDGHLTFTEGRGRIKWDLTAAAGKLTGTRIQGDNTATVTGVPAPKLDRPAPGQWSQPEPLFNGKDLTGWIPDKPSKNHWKVEDGDLVNEAPGANIRTAREFQDFKLHVEFNCPQDGNSGVYLRGRYELQVENETADKNDKLHGLGAIYGFIAPAADLPRKPGQWETFDVTLVGRTVTVVRDGVKTIDAQEIPGVTGGALNSNEQDPGPIYLQGDHTGGMKYRNITISVPQQ